jgi:hypothetical protein
MTLSRKGIAAAAVLVSAAVAAPAAAELDPRLAALRPMLGTWRGEFPNSTKEKPVVDVVRWESALNGKAVRTLHSINDGVYGGESLMFWDEEKKGLVYYYFTTGGFYTVGTLREEGGAIVAQEAVKGAAGGVTEVAATFRLQPDGRVHVETRHLKGGQWEDARDMYYVRAPDAQVKFKD